MLSHWLDSKHAFDFHLLYTTCSLLWHYASCPRWWIALSWYYGTQQTGSRGNLSQAAVKINDTLVSMQCRSWDTFASHLVLHLHYTVICWVKWLSSSTLFVASYIDNSFKIRLWMLLLPKELVKTSVHVCLQPLFPLHKTRPVHRTPQSVHKRYVLLP